MVSLWRLIGEALSEVLVLVVVHHIFCAGSIVTKAMRSQTDANDFPVSYSHKYFKAFRFHFICNEKAGLGEGLLIRGG